MRYFYSRVYVTRDAVATLSVEQEEHAGQCLRIGTKMKRLRFRRAVAVCLTTQNPDGGSD